MRLALDWLSRTARTGVGLALVVMAIAGSAQATGGGPPLPTPEIDPGSMGSALTLLLGGAMLLRRQRDKN
jgi:hypothetical protein